MTDDRMNFRLKRVGELPQFLLPALVTGFDITGDRQIHVERDGLDDSPKDALQFGRLPTVTVDGGFDEVRHRQGVATDIPARFQADPLVSRADRERTFELRFVEGAGEQADPVPALRALQMIDRDA